MTIRHATWRRSLACCSTIFRSWRRGCRPSRGPTRRGSRYATPATGCGSCSGGWGPRRRLLAYAGIWTSRLHDLRAEQLSGYGAVADGLDAALNPGLDEISRALEHLARLAGGAGQP